MSWNFRNWPGRPLTVLRFCFVRSPRKHRSRSGTRKSNRWSSKGTQNLLHNLLDCEECKWVFKTCYPLKEFSRRAIVTIISALVHSTQSEKKKKKQRGIKMRNHLWLVHKSYHMSYKYYIKTMRKCANIYKYHTTSMFPQHEFTINLLAGTQRLQRATVKRTWRANHYDTLWAEAPSRRPPRWPWHDSLLIDLQRNLFKHPLDVHKEQRSVQQKSKS